MLRYAEVICSAEAGVSVSKFSVWIEFFLLHCFSTVCISVKTCHVDKQGYKLTARDVDPNMLYGRSA